MKHLKGPRVPVPLVAVLSAGNAMLSDPWPWSSRWDVFWNGVRGWFSFVGSAAAVVGALYLIARSLED